MAFYKLLYFLFLLSISSSCAHSNIQSEKIPCDFIENLENSKNLSCGQLEVPENHSITEGKKIQIRYIVLHSSTAQPNAYPMLFFSGGPGGTTLNEGTIQNFQNHPIHEHRDIILFDQRGIQHSSALPNLEPGLYKILAQNLNIKEEEEKFTEHFKTIQQECEQKGLALENYNSYQNARDVGLLMEALGYQKYNLYGVSYGTRLARIVQEIFPEKINSVVINAPNPPGGDFLSGRLHSYSLALGRVLSFCENDVDCAQNYPNLKDEYLKAIENLHLNPIDIELKEMTFTVNPQDALYVIRRQLYRNDSREKVPKLIREFTHGGGPIMQSILQNELEFMNFFNSSMWVAVERYEMFELDKTRQEIDKTYESLELLPAKLALFNSVFEVGRNWHNGRISDQESHFNKSKIPTIIFVNQYDPVTPPEEGEKFNESLANGQLFIMDEGGHGGGDASCRNRVMIDFMNEPHQTLDISCLNLYSE